MQNIIENINNSKIKEIIIETSDLEVDEDVKKINEFLFKNNEYYISYLTNYDKYGKTEICVRRKY